MLNGSKPAIAVLASLMLIGSILSGLSIVSAQSSITLTVQWEQYYEDTAGNVGDSVTNLIQTRDGGYAFIALMSTYSLLGPGGVVLIKTDSSGAVEWQRTITRGSSVGLVETSDEGYVLVADHENGNGTSLIKVDSNGNVVWNQSYSVPSWGYTEFLMPTSDGGFKLAIYENPDGKIRFIQTDSVGNIKCNQMLEKWVGGTPQILQTDNGTYTFLGSTRHAANLTEVYAWSSNAMLVKTDSYGNVLWNKTYEDNWAPSSLVQTSDRGYVFIDEVGQPGTRTAVKTDSEGNVQWTHSFDPGSYYSRPGRASIGSVIETSDGSFVFAGTKSAAYGGQPSYMWLVKTDSSGNTEWSTEFGSKVRLGYGYSGGRVIQTSDGNLVVGGGWAFSESVLYYNLAKIQVSLPLPNPTPSPMPPMTPGPSPSSTETSGANLSSLNQTLLPVALLAVIVAVVATLTLFLKKRRSNSAPV